MPGPLSSAPTLARLAAESVGLMKSRSSRLSRRGSGMKCRTTELSCQDLTLELEKIR